MGGSVSTNEWFVSLVVRVSAVVRVSFMLWSGESVMCISRQQRSGVVCVSLSCCENTQCHKDVVTHVKTDGFGVPSPPRPPRGPPAALDAVGRPRGPTRPPNYPRAVASITREDDHRTTDTPPRHGQERH